MSKKQSQFLCGLTNDADRFPDESESSNESDVFGPTTGRPQPNDVLDTEESNQTNFLENKNKTQSQY